ncbi:MAG TPA: ABC transporter ATP-binding protein [Microthrixaceae bacterium]|nr:ABC transporter ATP-binding protein [Microthrixaceae bacterium]
MAEPDVSLPVVELEGVAIGYDHGPVVHDVDLTVRRGEVVAVLGANGSGKSTLVKGILGLAKVTAGELRLLGESAQSFRDRARIGYVPQRSWVAGSIPVTVRELVASGRLARMRPWRPTSPDDRLAVDTAIAIVGLDGRERRRLDQLSGGQQRRALIARALAPEPDLLILDEPTAGVDAPHQVKLAETLASLVERGTTVVLVAHELGPAAPIITRVVTMRAGRVAYDGPPRAEDHDGGHHLHAHGDEPRPFDLGLKGL